MLVLHVATACDTCRDCQVAIVYRKAQHMHNNYGNFYSIIIAAKLAPTPLAHQPGGQQTAVFDYCSIYIMCRY